MLKKPFRSYFLRSLNKSSFGNIEGGVPKKRKKTIEHAAAITCSRFGLTKVEVKSNAFYLT